MLQENIALTRKGQKSRTVHSNENGDPILDYGRFSVRRSNFGNVALSRIMLVCRHENKEIEEKTYLCPVQHDSYFVMRMESLAQ